MIKKLSLKDFEHNISAATWLAADELVQAGKVKMLREVEKHFWVASVEDGEAVYETEQIITPHKIKAFTCECFTEGRSLMCAHVAATLIKVRQFLEQRAQERENRRDAAAAAATAEPSRLTVQDALENVPSEALEEFVREYARRDRDFALALKTYFAGTVTEAENPYALVLDSVVPKNLPAKPFREPDFRRLRKTLDDLEMQMNDAILQLHHRTAFQLSSAVLLKLSPLLPKLEEPRREVVLENFRTAFNKMIEMADVQGSAIPAHLPPPELRDAAWDTVFSLGEQGLLPTELLRDSIRFLGSTATDEPRFLRIRDLFDRTPHPASTFVVHLFLSALAVREMPQAAVRVLQDYADQPQVLRDAILQLYYLNHWPTAVLVAEYFLNAPVQPELRTPNLRTSSFVREVEDVLLFIAEKTGDRDRQITYLRRRFRQSGNLDTFTRLKALFQEDWPSELRSLISELRLSGDLSKLAAILAAENEAESLAALVGETEHFALFQRHEALLLEWNKAFVRDRYAAHLTDYLREHFGPPASAQVRLHLVGLLRLGETELVHDLIQVLTEEFPDRLTLPGELKEIFPKSRKMAVAS